MRFWLPRGLLVATVLLNSDGFTPASRSPAFGVSSNSLHYRTIANVNRNVRLKNDDEPLIVMYAKKKKNAAKAAALEALDTLDEIADEPLSLKEQKQAAKKKKKASQKNDPKAEALAALDELDLDELDAPMTKKELKLAAKKKEKEAKRQQQPATAKNAKAAALAALDEIDLDDDDNDDRPMTKKELKALKKKQPQPVASVQEDEAPPPVEENKLSKKELALQKALELEALDAQKADEQQQLDEEPKLSKKEQKAAARRAEKLAAKEAKKEAAKLEAQPVNGDANGAEVPVKKDKLTLEDKIRKERPPPKIRIMESAQPGYVGLRLENVGITFRDQEVLKDVTWGVQTGDRIGLVGANGAGKTTQLRIMSGEMEPTTGDVVKSSQDLRVAILKQEFVDELVPTRTLREEFMSVFAKENQILNDIRDAEIQLETLGDSGDPEEIQEILDRMSKLQDKADAKGVYALESRAQKAMDLMGFTEDEASDLVASFSGGWKMRIGLGKTLLLDPNVLLLDEPTNHLDLESVEWLEEFLRQQSIPMVIVSHDREFLDQVCTKIVDAEGGICNEYDGNYSRFLQLKKARMDSWQAAYNAQEKKIKEERQWINKFKVKQPQAVKQRKAKLEKLVASEDYVKKPPFYGKPFRFRFPDAPRLSPEVAEIKDLSHSYGNGETLNRLFDHVDLFVEKGDRIAVLGPNGSGKSTLLRILMSKEKADEGTAELVGANVVANYFEQNQADALDLDKTVIETIQGASSNQSYNELRALLGQFLFKGDAVEKKVRFLSGGEKARLSLACMMLRPANLLILDEPTNHLDIPAKEMLEEALQHFQGSVMVISHDRYFISKAATTIVAIEDKKLVKYGGDYKFYMEKSKQLREKVEGRAVQGVERIGAAPIIDLDALEEPKKKKKFGGAKNANMVSRKDKGVKNAKRMQKS